LEKDAEVNPCRVVFEDLCSKALSPAESAAFALRLAGEW
jgi:hypothetical protein